MNTKSQNMELDYNENSNPRSDEFPMKALDEIFTNKRDQEDFITMTYVDYIKKSEEKIAKLESQLVDASGGEQKKIRNQIAAQRSRINAKREEMDLKEQDLKWQKFIKETLI